MTELRQNIEIPLSAAELSAIVNPSMIELSLKWAKMYQKDGRAFIRLFQKDASWRMAAGFIRKAYDQCGALEDCRGLGKDFTEYAERVCPGRYAGLLADLLLIIYSWKDELTRPRR